jgi:hypothetical protein
VPAATIAVAAIATTAAITTPSHQRVRSAKPWVAN